MIEPMLLHTIDEAFDDDEWVSELKWDGIRFLYSTMDGVTFLTRHGTEISNRFPELMTNQLPKGLVLDGELILPDSSNEGKPDFEGLMSRFQVKRTNRIPIVSKANPTTFCAFDVIYYHGKDVSNLPLTSRKELLNEILPEDGARIVKTLSITGNGKSLFNLIKHQDLEGIVLKKKDSRYEIGKRSKKWLKVINFKYITVSVIGVRKAKFGWLLQFSDTKNYAGVLELGVPREARRMVYELARSVKGQETKDYYYFPNDSLKCRVKYRALSKAGLLRLPSFIEFAG